jgi:MFS family permease
MQPFIRLYGHYDPTKGIYVLSSRTQSITSSIINAGEFLGAISSFVIGDRLGRRGGLFVSSTCVIIGTTIQVADTHIGALIAGRLVLGMYSYSDLLLLTRCLDALERFGANEKLQVTLSASYPASFPCTWPIVPQRASVEPWFRCTNLS